MMCFHGNISQADECEVFQNKDERRVEVKQDVIKREIALLVGI